MVQVRKLSTQVPRFPDMLCVTEHREEGTAEGPTAGGQEGMGSWLTSSRWSLR